MYIKNFIILLTLLPSPVFSSNQCQGWFDGLKINTKETNCVLKCTSSMTDMSSFNCPNQCDDLCKKQKKCEISTVSRKLLKESLHFPEDNKTIKTHKFSLNEAKQLQRVLAKVNPSLLQGLKGVVKLSPSSPLDMGNSSQYVDRYIILYPKVFQKDLLPYIVHELGHHLHEFTNQQAYKNYLKSMKWTRSHRPGNFLSSDSKRDSSEDFTTNFENYILNPGALKNKVPSAYKWMRKNFKNKFNLKDCDHE